MFPYVPANQITAIVGASGDGKTTFAIKACEVITCGGKLGNTHYDPIGMVAWVDGEQTQA